MFEYYKLGINLKTHVTKVRNQIAWYVAFRTVPTRHYLTPKQTLKSYRGFALGLVGSALGLLVVSFWDPLYVLKCLADPSLFLPPVSPPVVYSKYTCRYIWSFFSSDLMPLLKSWSGSYV